MPKLPRHNLANVIAQMSLKTGTDTKALAKSVAAYLLEERRTPELDSLLRDIQKSWAHYGYVNVLAHVARPLPNEVYNDLLVPFKERYSRAQVTLTPVISPSVIGGANLELAEERMDISIARRLRRFKKAINVKGN